MLKHCGLGERVLFVLLVFLGSLRNVLVDWSHPTKIGWSKSTEVNRFHLSISGGFLIKLMVRICKKSLTKSCWLGMRFTEWSRHRDATQFSDECCNSSCTWISPDTLFSTFSYQPVMDSISSSLLNYPTKFFFNSKSKFFFLLPLKPVVICLVFREWWMHGSKIPANFRVIALSSATGISPTGYSVSWVCEADFFFSFGKDISACLLLQEGCQLV